MLIGTDQDGFNVYLDDPFLHVYCIGNPGTGKTALMKSVLSDVMHRKWGCIVLDPGGDLAPDAVGFVPKNRRKDVILIDRDHMAVYNPLALAHDDDFIIQSFILSLMRVIKLFNPEQTITPLMYRLTKDALLQMFDDGSRDIGELQNRLYNLKGSKEERESAQRVATRLDLIIGTKRMKQMLTGKNQIDIHQIAQEGKLLLIDGRFMDPLTFSLVGLLITSEMRAYIRDQRLKDYKPLLLMVDEFQCVLSTDFADIFAQARKCKVACWLSHQNMRQASKDMLEVIASIHGAAGNHIIFRVPYYEAELTSRETKYEVDDILNVDDYHCFARLKNKNHKLKIYPPPIGTQRVREDVLSYLTPRFEESDLMRVGEF